MMVYEQSLHGGSRNDTVRYWQQFMGAKSPGDPALDAISPYRLADRVKVPVLLIHGVDDTVVPFDQSRIMADALTKAGKKVQFVRLQGEDHWLSRSATRMQMLQAVSDFLDVNLPVTSALPGGGKAIATH
jgi:dipeptidyl aminopeptidase/acylaminoacyl peptidase